METRRVRDRVQLATALALAIGLGLAAAVLTSSDPASTGQATRSVTLALTGRMRALAAAPGPFLSFVVVVSGFAYGLLHGAMPGHRKAVLVSYFAGRDVRPVDALSTGLLLGVLHCLLASAIVLASWQLLSVSFGEGVSWTTLVVERAAALVLLLLGLWLLLRRSSVTGSNQLHIEDTKRRTGSLDLHSFTRAPKRRDTGTAAGRRALLAGAVIPCPGSSLLMVFAVSIGAPVAGILAVTGMALGMGLTMALFAVSSVVLRRFVLLQGRSAALGRIHMILDRSTAMFISAFAAGILLGL